jgi:hypothetical protein
VLGDYNNDGSVDAADYVLWRNGGPLANESDMPGTVNEADYTFWRSRFGATSGSGATLDAASVPEPTSTAVVLSGIALYFATSLGSGELCRVATCERRNGCHC